MISVFERDGEPDITADIVTGLEQISNIYRALLLQQATEHKLSSLQVQILLCIYFNKDEKLNSVLLARKLHLSKATISVALKSMEQKRLIVKRKEDKDQRSRSILLTDWGKQIAHIAGFYPEPLRKIIAPISTREKDILLKNIKGIISKLGITEE